MIRRPLSLPGSTLIELMASMAVLSVLMVILVQATGAVSKTWQKGAARVDNLTQARVVLGMIDRDVQSMVLRPDLATFVDETGAPACAFYSMLPGTEGDRRLSLVSYAIDPATFGLTRKDYGMDYNTRVITLNETTMLPDLGRPEAVKETFAAGAICFKCQFLTADGTVVNQFLFDYDKPREPANTRSMVVSLLLLDNAALAMARELNLLPTLTAKFNSSSTPGRSYVELWKETISSLPPTFPEPVRAGLRLFERSITIPCP